MLADYSMAEPPTTLKVPETSPLKRAAIESGILLGTFTVRHQLLNEPAAAAILANTFSMIADGNDLKFSNYLRPAPDTWDFSYGDPVVAWAEQHGLLFRGHCLAWWNALPDWFSSYVTTANAEQVLTTHINRVVQHYKGRVYSWDVVNEPIMPDHRPDGLGRKPWLDLLGPEYIDLAFHTAHAADSKARLVLNENYIEHNTPAENERRRSLLALIVRLKKSGVPVDAVGIQGHLRGSVPLDKSGLTRFLKQVQDLGLEVMITELDVDDIGVPDSLADETVAAKYAEFIDLAGPYVKSITFEELSDEPGVPHRPNLFDRDYQPAPAYYATAKALMTVKDGTRT